MLRIKLFVFFVLNVPLQIIITQLKDKCDLGRVKEHLEQIYNILMLELFQ